MPMTKAELTVWSAVFARTNYGQPTPTVDDMRRYRTAAAHGTNLPAMINMVCADYIETDEHADMFADEAESWRMEFETKELEFIFETWRGKRDLWEASEVVA